MPFNIQPILRSNQKARELAYFSKTLDSVGHIIRTAQELAGTQVKDVPKITIDLDGIQHIPS